jgi:uncharacterized membrane protein YccC
MMAEETPAAVEVEAPDAPPDDLADLDENARRLVEAARRDAADARSESATHRRLAKEAEDARAKLARQHESEQERRDRETEERIRAAVAGEYEPQLTALRLENLDERIKVRAAGRFADPDDAPLYVDRTALAGVEPGKRDAAIDRALADVLERKAHLGLAQSTPGLLVSQGARSQQPDGRAERRSWLR